MHARVKTQNSDFCRHVEFVFQQFWGSQKQFENLRLKPAMSAKKIRFQKHLRTCSLSAHIVYPIQENHPPYGDKHVLETYKTNQGIPTVWALCHGISESWLKHYVQDQYKSKASVEINCEIWTVISVIHGWRCKSAVSPLLQDTV